MIDRSIVIDRGRAANPGDESMRIHRAWRLAPALLVLGLVPRPGLAAEPALTLPKGIAREEQPRDPGLVKIVLVAGSSVYKPGEHEYVAGCSALIDLLRQTPG